MTTPPQSLPIWSIRDELLAALRDTNRLVVSAPTGSGKSTQIPQMLVDSAPDLAPVLVLQPRRLAARMLARRVAHERGAVLGQEVGYQVRFDDRSSRTTRIKYVTDGVALRSLIGNTGLQGIRTLVFDEFHERHAVMDVALALVRQLQQTTRPDLRLIVMSATLDTAHAAAALAPCATINSAGRAFPVGIEYLAHTLRPEREPVWSAAAREFERLAGTHADGDVLVFMPGAYEIRRTVDELRRCRAARDAVVMPLHGEMRAEDQDAAMDPCAQRKIVVATNVAETSLTIDGITLVIDCGLARKARFDPYRGINTLLIEKISRASADQRAGRAGRTRPGHCMRLWTEAEHSRLAQQDAPEIQRIDLAELALVLLQSGVRNLDAFPWMDPPDPRSLSRALTLLGDLAAIDPATLAPTDVGRRLLSFPVHPRIGAMLLAADQLGCVPSMALIAALIQERSILLPRQNRHILEKREAVLGDSHGSDLLFEAAAWHYAARHGFDRPACEELGIHAQDSRRVESAKGQLTQIAEQVRLNLTEHAPPAESLLRCVLTGFSDQVACRVSSSARYELVHRRRGTLDKQSAAHGAAMLVATEITEIGTHAGEVEVRLSQASALDPAWLRALFPQDFTTRREIAYDRAARQVFATELTLFRDLVIEQKRGAPPSDEEIATIIAHLVLKGELTLKHWDHAVEQWIARVNLLAERCPDFGLPVIDDNARREIVAHVCLGARGARDAKDRPVWPVLRAWLPASQRTLVETLAPERVSLSNGRTPRITYDGTKPPCIAMRIQELYDVTAPITIARGRIPVLVHVLAPNNRPVQITDDLGSFWRNGYERAKKELKGRYPRHEWR